MDIKKIVTDYIKAENTDYVIMVARQVSLFKVFRFYITHYSGG
jgi:hypothetical protein